MASMDDLPDRLPEEVITDADVRNDAAHILGDMHALRGEGLTDRGLTDAKLDEYLHLAHRLAGLIKSYADDKLTEKVVAASTALDRQPRLLQYDPMQDTHWKEHDPKFVRNLDDILISLTRERFDTVEKRHHVLQALKFIAATGHGVTPEEREQAYLTIKPYHGGVPLIQDWTDKLIGALIGERFDVNAPDAKPGDEKPNLEAEVAGPVRELPIVLGRLARQGYSTAYAIIPRQDLDTLKRSYPDATPVGDAQRELKPTFLGKLAGTIVKYTKPISYLILGALPRRVQEYAEARMGKENYNGKSAFTYSTIAEAIVSVGSAATLAFATGSWWFAGLALPGVIEAACRYSLSDGSKHHHNYTYEGPVGTLAGKLATLPFSGGMAEELRRHQSLVRVRVPLQQHHTAPAATLGGKLAALAAKELPDECEQNLVWSADNTNQYGKLFLDKLTGVTEPAALISNAQRAVKYTSRVRPDQADIPGKLLDEITGVLADRAIDELKAQLPKVGDRIMLTASPAHAPPLPGIDQLPGSEGIVTELNAENPVTYTVKLDKLTAPSRRKNFEVPGSRLIRTPGDAETTAAKAKAVDDAKRIAQSLAPPGEDLRGIEQAIDRPSHYVALGAAEQVGPYAKRNALICRSGTRYLVTAIVEGAQAPSLADITRSLIPGAGEEGKPSAAKTIAEAAEALAKQSKAAYIRVAQYERGRLTDEKDVLRE